MRKVPFCFPEAGCASPGLFVRRSLATILLTVWGASALLASNPDKIPETPPEQHLPLIWKVICSDRAAAKDFGEELVMGVVYQKKYRLSALVMQQLEALILSAPPEVRGFECIRVVPIDIDDRLALEQTLLTNRDPLYCTTIG